MTSGPKHKWTFRARFRRGAFGWRSQPAVGRVREAVSEIRKAARKDPDLGAEGAVPFLEKMNRAGIVGDSLSWEAENGDGRFLGSDAALRRLDPDADDGRGAGHREERVGGERAVLHRPLPRQAL